MNNTDTVVRANELITAVQVISGETPLAMCSSLDENKDGEVSAAELTGVIAAMFRDCS